MKDTAQSAEMATPLSLPEPQDPVGTTLPLAGLAILGVGLSSLVLMQVCHWADTRHLLLASLAVCAVILVGVFTILYRTCRQRKRTEFVLREYARHHRRMFDAVVDGMMVFTPDGTIVDANPTACDMHGYTHDAFIGLNGAAIIHPAYHRLFHEFLQQTDLGQIFSAEGKDLRKDGSVFPVEVRGSFFEYNGQKLLLVVFQDVSLRKKAEAALCDSEERIRAITDSAHDAILMMDAQGCISYWNPAAERIFGYTSEEAIGGILHQIIVPKRFQGAYDKGFAKFQANGTGPALGRTLELAGRHKNGRELPITLSLSSIQFQGEWHAIGVIRDETKGHRQREDLRASKERFSQVAEQSGELIWEIDGSGLFKYVSRACESLLGYAKKEIVNQLHFYDLRPEHCRESLRREMLAAFEQKKDFKNLPNDIVAKDGHTLNVLTSGGPILDADGVLCGYRGSDKDVTVQKRAEEELRELATALAAANQSLEEMNRIAEAATRAKSEFLANMSHEIRTPMTAILGYADILASGMEAPEHVAAVQTIRNNGKHLLMLLNDILDISKIEAGKLDVERITCEPASIVSDVVSLLRIRAREKGIALKLVFDGPCPKTVRTDPTRLRQILVNLVGNAIKFTDRGEVCVTVRLADRDSASPRLECDVRDTGIGMTAGQIEGLFQPFHQADASMSRRFGGTGLGLAISQRLAKLLGGELTATGELGRGSQFRVVVAIGPQAGVELIDHAPEVVEVPAPSTPESKAAGSDLTGLHILVAEDGADNQRLLEFVLTHAGARVEVVGEGQRAVEMTLATLPGRGRRAGDPTTPFDVVLMDMQMPIVDGYEATRRLRAVGYDHPIIALTAHSVEDERLRCLEAGCSDFSTKPVNRLELLALVAHWAARSQTDPEFQTAVWRSENTDHEPPQDYVYSDLSADPEFAELVELFVQEMPQRVDTLRMAVQQQDWNQLARSAHQLKGAAGSYGFDAITDRAAQLETAVRGNHDESAILQAFDELTEMCARARAGVTATP